MSLSRLRILARLLAAVVVVVLVLLGFDTLAEPAGRPIKLFVSTEGSDRWAGTLSVPNADRTNGPFATLERARDALRELRRSGARPAGSAVVYIRGGNYRLDRTFRLQREDGGEPGTPTIYAAYQHEIVRIRGDSPVTGWRTTTDAAILARLPASARGKVLESDLRAQGIVDYGQLSGMGFDRPQATAPLELFFQDRPMTLARWPNSGEWAHISGTPSGLNGGSFNYASPRPHQAWGTAPDIWVHGYWGNDWADSLERVVATDDARQLISTAPPHGVFGYRVGHRFFALNLLEEIDSPGEWYLDRRTGILYFWPPGPIDQGGASVSTLSGPLVSIQGAAHIELRGLILEGTRGPGLELVNTVDCRLSGGIIRNAGGVGMQVVNGVSSGLDSSDVHAVGQGGIYLAGGDRQTLTAANDFVSNCQLSDFNRWVFTYRPGVKIGGVGNRVDHTLIKDAPHAAVIVSGNDHVVEYNDITNVCTETSDAGAVYMGRDFTQRGTIIRFNRIHDIGPPDRVHTMNNADVVGVYLDDFSSGTTVTGNLFVWAGRSVLVGGGRDNVVSNNLFVDSNPSIQVDQRGKSWAAAHTRPGDGWGVIERVRAVPYDRGPYLRYPHLARLLEDDPAAAKYNRIEHNVYVGSGKPITLLDGLDDRSVEVGQNWVADRRDLESRDQGEFQLKQASAAVQHGFAPLPLAQIGPQIGPRRR
jgi:hypothetical protein